MYNLVIVEDDYLIRTGLGNMFPWHEIGFEVVGCFENGRDALNFIKENSVDIILSDIRMPIMTGLELAAELSRVKPEITVVFLSAYEDFDYARQAIDFGVRKYLVKSTKYDHLVLTFQKIKIELDNNQQKDDIDPIMSIESSGNKKIEQIIEYIRNNYNIVTLQNTADTMKMSPVYLSRYFKEKTGVLFIEYVTEVRMKVAANLIMNSQHKLYEISEMVGYSNPKNFSRAFRNFFKTSPNEFRNRKH